MNRRIANLALLALALTWAVACVPRVKEPEVRLAGVRVGGLGLQGGMLYVRLSVVNPNRFDLRAKGLTYDIELSDPAASDGGWSKLAEGSFNEEVEVGARDSTVVEIPVEFRYRGVGGALRSILETGTFSYRVRGTVAVESPMRLDIPYRQNGMVTLTGGLE